MKPNGKTIRQIAVEIGVSKQAVQKRLSKDPLYTEIQPYMSTIGGTNYIDVVGENIIKSVFYGVESTTTDNQSTTSAGNQSTTDASGYLSTGGNKSTSKKPDAATTGNQSTTSSDNQIYDLLKTTLDALQRRLLEQDKQMTVKDKQIEELNERLAEAHKMADQAQQLHGVDKALELGEQQLITDGSATSEDKPTFKDRLKYLFKGER